MEGVQFKLLFSIFLMVFLLVPIQEAKDIRYCTNKDYQIKFTGATVSLDPVPDGRLITFTLSAFTDQAIFGGDMVVDLSFYGVHFHSEKYNLCDGVSCPISVGDFVLTLTQVLPLDVSPGSYSLKMKLLSKDGGQLSCAGFNFTIPYPQLVSDL